MLYVRCNKGHAPKNPSARKNLALLIRVIMGEATTISVKVAASLAVIDT